MSHWTPKDGFANRACYGAFRKGKMNAELGFGSKCPYQDHTTRRGAVTFSRGIIKAWHDGFAAGTKARAAAARANGRKDGSI